MHSSSDRPIRRADRALAEAEARAILAAASHGTLATVGVDGWPYAVTVNHWVEGDRIYLHCASSGHKLENIAHDSRVCFTAFTGGAIDLVKQTTRYESAVVFGHAVLVEDEREKQRVLELALLRLQGICTEKDAAHIAALLGRTTVVAVQMERVTGKANRAKAEAAAVV